MENRALKILQGTPKEFNQEHTICAVILDKRGRVLSNGYNSYNKSHPRQFYYAEKIGNRQKIYLHAELDAIIRLNYLEIPHTIHIARINKKGEPVCSKPCSMCELAIKDAGIKNVIYT